MHIFTNNKNRLLALELILTGLVIVLVLMLEIRQIGPMARMNADSTYSPAPTYGVLRVPDAGESKNLHAAPGKVSTAKEKRLSRIRARKAQVR